MPSTPPRLLLLAATTGYQTRIFAEAARRLGFALALATDRCHILEDPWGDQAIPVRFDDPVPSVELIAREGPFDALLAIGDRPTLVASMAARRLGVPHNPPEAVAACRDKYLSRQLFQAAGMRVPPFFRAGLEEDPRELAARAPYPCVLKPLALSGSRGVIRANGPVEFAAAFERIRGILSSPGVRGSRIQVEGFIPGSEFAVEGLVTDGRLDVVAIFDKPDPLDGPFFEETIYVTPSRAAGAVQESLAATARQAVRALGLTRGPVHAELRANADGAWILEVAARPIGGLCARVLQFEGAVPYEEVILRHAAGEDVSRARPARRAAGVMMIPIPRAGVFDGVDGVERASSVPGIEEVIVSAKPGHALIPLPEGSSYLGFIFSQGAGPAEAERALRLAHAELRFRISTALKIV